MNQSNTDWDLTDIISRMKLKRPLTQNETIVAERCLSKRHTLTVACQHVAHFGKSA